MARKLGRRGRICKRGTRRFNGVAASRSDKTCAKKTAKVAKRTRRMIGMNCGGAEVLFISATCHGIAQRPWSAGGAASPRALVHEKRKSCHCFDAAAFSTTMLSRSMVLQVERPRRGRRSMRGEREVVGGTRRLSQRLCFRGPWSALSARSLHLKRRRTIRGERDAVAEPEPEPGTASFVLAEEMGFSYHAAVYTSALSQ